MEVRPACGTQCPISCGASSSSRARPTHVPAAYTPLLTAHRIHSHSHYPSTSVAAPLGAAPSRSASAKAAGLNARVAAVLGSQWGDEGKGKLADVLAKK